MYLSGVALFETEQGAGVDTGGGARVCTGDGTEDGAGVRKDIVVPIAAVVGAILLILVIFTVVVVAVYVCRKKKSKYKHGYSWRKLLFMASKLPSCVLCLLL